MDAILRLLSIVRASLSEQLDHWEVSQRLRGVSRRSEREARWQATDGKRFRSDDAERAQPGAERREGGRQSKYVPPSSANGMPYDAQLAQYYANLEIPYGSDAATARKAWKSMMKKYHPDLHGQDAERQKTATILTQELTAALRAIEAAQ